MFLTIELKRRLIAATIPTITVAKGGAIDYDPDVVAPTRPGYNRDTKLHPL